MGIQKDAGELLVRIYNYYLEDQTVDSSKLSEEIKWEGTRINRAIMYLSDHNLIKMHSFLGRLDNGIGNFLVAGLTPEGINIIENEPKFETTFGVNLGVFSFSVKQK